MVGHVLEDGEDRYPFDGFAQVNRFPLRKLPAHGQRVKRGCRQTLGKAQPKGRKLHPDGFGVDRSVAPRNDLEAVLVQDVVAAFEDPERTRIDVGPPHQVVSLVRGRGEQLNGGVAGFGHGFRGYDLDGVGQQVVAGDIIPGVQPSGGKTPQAGVDLGESAECFEADRLAHRAEDAKPVSACLASGARRKRRSVDKVKTQLRWH
jgi:hypothetical protein